MIQLSFEPFYIDMERRGVQLVDIGLNQVAEAIREGEIDGGPVPLTDSFEMDNYAAPVAGFCLSSATRSGSNLFYSRVPIEELDGGRIALSEVDPTTVQLLQVLLAKKYKVGAPELVQTADEHDALVISGDAALRRRRGMRGYGHRYDLGYEWHRFTGLPFVSARWMRKGDMEHRDAMLLEDTLYVGLEDGVDTLYHMNEPRDDLLMLPRDVVAHLQGIRYFIGLSEQKGINRFRECLAQIDR